jgi:cytochrome oxidase Cu insertion factor (SCO1/SenC/PrrC family)
MHPYARLLIAILTAPLALLLAACGGGGIAVGNAAPAFTLPNAAGGEVSLSDYQGQPVLLYFHMAGG